MTTSDTLPSGGRRPDPRQGAERGRKASRPRIFIATGASGGHIFPGLAIAHVLRRQGYWCTFIGSARQFSSHIREQGFDIIPLPAGQVNVPGVVRKFKALQSMGLALFKAAGEIRRHKPVAVLGMGSYASVATVLAGKALRVPTLIHEQNARPGRANLFLSRFVSRVLLAFAPARKYFPAGEKKPEKFQVVGNPVRADVLALRGEARPAGKNLNLLVVGGSQGARILTDILPEALDKLPKKLRQKISVTQQARPEDVDRLEEAYSNLALANFTVSSFFNDLPALMHKAHVVVCRAGTGTISELAVLNRAAILVPIRLADGHQVDNAKILSGINAATLMKEQNLTPGALAAELESLLTREGKRTLYEKNTTLVAKPRAAEEAAEEVVRISGGDAVEEPPEVDTTTSPEEDDEPTPHDSSS